LIKQLLTSASDGVRVQAEEFGENAIASVSQLDGFQPGEQTTLLLVEQAVEKQDGRFQFIGRYLESGGIGQQRNRLGDLPGAELIASLPAISGGVQESSGHLGAAQTVGAHEIVEGILDLNVENVGQFIGEAAVRGLVDEGLDGGDESAVTGKPNCIVGPQANVVETGGFAESIITAAMGTREVCSPPSMRGCTAGLLYSGPAEQPPHPQREQPRRLPQ
jgi:hypothetical protein